MVGFGAIGRSLATIIRQELPHVSLVGIATRTSPGDRDRSIVPAGTHFVASPAALAELGADVVIECAGHAALASYVPVLLRAGHEVLVASVGALADRALEATIKQAASEGCARVLLSTGAIGAVDLLCAARVGGLREVRYTGRKPPRAWLGTRAEALAQGAEHSGRPVDVFEGTAREAALRFPQNANVAATVALAGMGFEETRVRLLADPDLQVNEHEIQAQGNFGRFDLVVRGNPQVNQPRTSTLVAMSLARCLMHRQLAMTFG